jgi:transcriptional regulator GlxA family with amidase domain
VLTYSGKLMVVAHKIRLRLEHAVDLLQNQNVSIGEAAEACGFSDLFHFSRMFKQKMGFPPSALRSPSSIR